ncbi:hypothetical protein AD951_06085 [Acetobacter malorum]|uniref:Helix-turn-helix domain-containing protein n=1 Tax=Acetobacter malorum TaxID=178901 RepID=A0A149UNF8_9PROT|nr:hypothetical protein AD951_06085 [Acetobacter malorum]
MPADPPCQTGPTITLPVFMTVPEAAMAVRRHPETLRRAIRQGRLAAWRQRGCTLVSPEALRAYMEDFFCPASATKSLISNAVEASTTSSGGSPESVTVYRQEQRMRRSLDKR